MRASTRQPPLDEQVVEAAIGWLIRLRCEDDDAIRAECQRWRAQHPDHELAWDRICSVDDGLGRQRARLNANAASNAIEHVIRHTSRRQTLKTLLGVGGIAVLATWQRHALEAQWYTWQADETSGTGEQRRLALPDGTQLMLNTATALDIRYDAHNRLLLLHHGEILVETAADSLGRPFAVATPDGRVVPIGTRFTVQHEPAADVTSVQVLAGQVDIRVANGTAGNAVRLAAGQGGTFNRHSVLHTAPVHATTAAWTDGILAADDMRLDDFLAELDRYRPGLLRCDPAVGSLRITGTFPLRDTDRILDSLPRILPVRITRRSRYWVAVQAVTN